MVATFVEKKEKDRAPEDRERGDCWGHVALGPDSRLVVSTAKPVTATPLRSTHSYTARRYGHKWVVRAVLVKFSFATMPWALPALIDLYRSAKPKLPSAAYGIEGSSFGLYSLAR